MERRTAGIHLLPRTRASGFSDCNAIYGHKMKNEPSAEPDTSMRIRLRKFTSQFISVPGSYFIPVEVLRLSRISRILWRFHERRRRSSRVWDLPPSAKSLVQAGSFFRYPPAAAAMTSVFSLEAVVKARRVKLKDHVIVSAMVVLIRSISRYLLSKSSHSDRLNKKRIRRAMNVEREGDTSGSCFYNGKSNIYQ